MSKPRGLLFVTNSLAVGGSESKIVRLTNELVRTGTDAGIAYLNPPETLLSAVHTRSIVDPDYAFKFTGKRGRNTYGLLFASDNAPGNLDDNDRDFIRGTEDLSAVRRRDALNGTSFAADLQSERDSLLKRLDQ